MNELLEQESIKIENMIYEVRGKQVMLDSDLAKLYQVETKRINEAVKNNPEKFPERFAFRISEFEYNCLKSKISTSKGGSRKVHTVFTEQGVAMLATILKSKVATQVSIDIMDAFVVMRKYLASNNHGKRISNIETKLIDYDQIYDAYSLLIDILREAKEKIIVIDNYVDKKFLDIISKIKIEVILITSNKCNLTDTDISKYNSEYHNLEIKYSNKFHDRFIIIDDSTLYHCGASLKDLGKKCFALNKIDDKLIKENLKREIKK